MNNDGLYSYQDLVEQFLKPDEARQIVNSPRFSALLDYFENMSIRQEIQNDAAPKKNRKTDQFKIIHDFLRCAQAYASENLYLPSITLDEFHEEKVINIKFAIHPAQVLHPELPIIIGNKDINEVDTTNRFFVKDFSKKTFLSAIKKATADAKNLERVNINYSGEQHLALHSEVRVLIEHGLAKGETPYDTIDLRDSFRESWRSRLLGPSRLADIFPSMDEALEATRKDNFTDLKSYFKEQRDYFTERGKEATILGQHDDARVFHTYSAAFKSILNYFTLNDMYVSGQLLLTDGNAVFMFSSKKINSEESRDKDIRIMMVGSDKTLPLSDFSKVTIGGIASKLINDLGKKISSSETEKGIYLSLNSFMQMFNLPNNSKDRGPDRT